MDDPEQFLAERLKAHGIDIYASARGFARFADRLAHALVVARYGPVVCGRHNGRPETYEQFIERAFGIKLRDVPRATVSNTKQSSTG